MHKIYKKSPENHITEHSQSFPLRRIFGENYGKLSVKLFYFFQKEGVKSIIRAKTSSRPASIRNDMTHFPIFGKKS